MTILFGLAVFLFWRVRYPFALTYQEQFQMFLFDSDYFAERMAEPGGLARYVAEFLVQFYNSPTLGAMILAVLMMLVQRLTWRMMRCESHYFLSFLPAVLLWYMMGDESVMLTYVVALLMAMGVMVMIGERRGIRDSRKIRVSREVRVSRVIRWGGIIVMIPVLYWLIGPMVVLVALFVMPLTVVWAVAVMVLSAHFVPFPLSRVMTGIGYYRFPEVIPYILLVIPVLIWILSLVVKRLPQPKPWMVWCEAVVCCAAVIGCPDLGYDAKKYELMEYDHLVRIRDWKGIIAKAEKQTPDLPMSVGATNLALYFYLGLINTAQRFAFEAMEAIPDYNKSARVIKRLAETNLINGEYDVAKKYLQMLDKTIFYRPWAQQTLAMLGDETQINAHPIYGTLRQYRLEDDFLFSEDELDKICGQLFMHNHHNQMATQYLVMAPLLDGDAQRFINYVTYVQSKVNYNPRYVREAIAKISRMR